MCEVHDARLREAREHAALHDADEGALVAEIGGDRDDPGGRGGHAARVRRCASGRLRVDIAGAP